MANCSEQLECVVTELCVHFGWLIGPSRLHALSPNYAFTIKGVFLSFSLVTFLSERVIVGFVDDFLNFWFDGGLSGGSSLRRTGSEDTHRRQLKCKYPRIEQCQNIRGYEKGLGICVMWSWILFKTFNFS